MSNSSTTNSDSPATSSSSIAETDPDARREALLKARADILAQLPAVDFPPVQIPPGADVTTTFRLKIERSRRICEALQPWTDKFVAWDRGLSKEDKELLIPPRSAQWDALQDYADDLVSQHCH
ncbi:hypothetical protein B0H16DRAFT_1875964 [Mycena metata]|uniref:Uncharacterized protein n=1 Tax=Mycena metata TaxID=1033252 RepID=A0AAD7KIT4_9AGAR|nr:hypothetical protein B0H16DRAFT_1875964 [Mycena metata]